MTRRRIARLARTVGLAVLSLAALLISRGGAESRAPAEVASSQWQRLVGRIAQAADNGRRGFPDPGTATEEGPPGGAPLRAVSQELPPGRARVPSRARLDDAVRERQAAEYAARGPKSVVELQQFRRTHTARVVDERGRSG
ncbi:MAG TPA: hypothetical protein VLA75_09870, partial [Thermoanaerobaculia bacterium]|nr:hypothetical protein [Thermoanaerobaculia bacterium]